MRKYYKRKVYDTETSEYICNTPDGKLYRKNSTIKFFIWHLKGSQFEPIPISWKQAEELIKQYGTRKQYDELFTPLSCYDPRKAKKRTTVAISMDDYSKLRIASGRRNVSIGEYLHLFINERYRQSEYRQLKNK